MAEDMEGGEEEKWRKGRQVEVDLGGRQKEKEEDQMGHGYDFGEAEGRKCEEEDGKNLEFRSLGGERRRRRLREAREVVVVAIRVLAITNVAIIVIRFIFSRGFISSRFLFLF